MLRNAELIDNSHLLSLRSVCNKLVSIIETTFGVSDLCTAPHFLEQKSRGVEPRASDRATKQFTTKMIELRIPMSSS